MKITHTVASLSSYDIYLLGGCYGIPIASLVGRERALSGGDLSMRDGEDMGGGFADCLS